MFVHCVHNGISWEADQTTHTHTQTLRPTHTYTHTDRGRHTLLYEDKNKLNEKYMKNKLC